MDRAGASRKQLERLTGVPPTEAFRQAGFAVRFEWGGGRHPYAGSVDLSGK